MIWYSPFLEISQLGLEEKAKVQVKKGREGQRNGQEELDLRKIKEGKKREREKARVLD